MSDSDVFRLAADLLDPPKPVGARVWYCGIPDCDGLPHQGVGYKHARGSQCPPTGDWYLWFILAGRGFGKTRTGAEWLANQMERYPNTYWALVAPTFDDGRDTMVEGESGLEMVLDSHKMKYTWNRSLGQMELSNASRLDLFSAEKPESLRGPNLMGAWGDEPATWKYPGATWDNLKLMTRKGDPKVVLTGTPTPSKFIKELVAEADHVTRGSSYENKDNLAPSWFRRVVEPLMGTRKGKQEVEGQVLEDVEGALWVDAQLDATRLHLPRRFKRVAVALDPSLSAKKRDLCGIAVGGLGPDGHGYLTKDLSEQLDPGAWVRKAIRTYHDAGADVLYAEGNNGGDLIKAAIHQVDRSVNVQIVYASRGKITRAEPVASLYGSIENPDTWEQATIHHDKEGDFKLLEDEMTTYVQGDPESPNRMDALVWLFTGLMGVKPQKRGGLRR